MGFRDSAAQLLYSVAERLGKTPQDDTYSQRVRDYQLKSDSYSIESEISEKLAGLVLMMSTMPVSGDTERASWLDTVSDRFYRTKAVKTLISGFLTGDCLVVPSWTGRTIQNILVPSEEFQIFSTIGDEITSCGYIVDRTTRGLNEYQLVQVIELVPYTSNDASTAFACHYKMYVAQDWNLSGGDLSDFPEWAENYDSDWYVPNVDRILVGRFKSFTTDPLNMNNVKGVPICFGASEPIAEIHYLLNQMHNEFNLSEKFIIANKRLFKKDGNGGFILPRGKEKIFMDVTPQSNESMIHDWSPDIRYSAYLEAVDKQEQLVERAVGVSRGIISTPNDMNYQNVDNVRKSQQSTIAFVDSARAQFEDCMINLIYAWNVLANYYQVTPIGDYAYSFDWSDDYIETFSDRQNAILAGEAIGATDAVDYRMFVFDESPEVARDRVAEIQANRPVENDLLTITAV